MKKNAAVVSSNRKLAEEKAQELKTELGFIPHVWTTKKLPMGELLGKYENVGTVYVCEDASSPAFDTWRVWASVSQGINFIE